MMPGGDDTLRNLAARASLVPDGQLVVPRLTLDAVASGFDQGHVEDLLLHGFVNQARLHVTN